MSSISEPAVGDSLHTSSGHRLSKRAQQLEWDFFFSYVGQNSFRLCGGLNLRRHPSLTVATLYRWLDLLDQDKLTCFYQPYKLWRITVTESHVLWFSAVRDGLPISPSSTELVQPGDYAAFSEWQDGGLHGRLIDGGGVGEPRPSFHEREQMILPYEEAETLVHNIMHEDVIAAVKQRDRGKCSLTGVTTSTEICWILPPVGANECHNPSRLFDRDAPSEACKVPENVITLHRDLVEPFTNNRFGIDVDDNYRIVVFQDLPTTLIQNDTHMPMPCTSADPSHRPGDEFLRYHFKWCLGVHFLGGDVRQDFPDGGQDLMDKAAEEGVDLSDPDWQTYPGTKIIQVMMEARLAQAKAEQDDEGVEDFEAEWAVSDKEPTEFCGKLEGWL